ncbi:TetR family transcriptional regulator [Chitinophagaceae bacterium IBVUCB1]|nr:TetR family transcriptional regulator [Chitinophagaceae bacterium IBVUCB1]
MDKQKEILNAALKLFTEYGFHGTPTSKIAQAAGVANGTLFHYYPTKDELIIALYADIKQRLGFCVMQGVVQTDSVYQQAKKFYTAALQWGIENSLEFRYVQQFTSSPYAAMLPEELKEQNNITINLIKQGIKEKTIKVIPAEYAMALISSHLYGVNQYINEHKMSAAKQKQFVAESFELIWKMIT